LKSNDILALHTKFFPQFPHNFTGMVIVGYTDTINEIFGGSTDKSNMAFFIQPVGKFL